MSEARAETREIPRGATPAERWGAAIRDLEQREPETAAAVRAYVVELRGEARHRRTRLRAAEEQHTAREAELEAQVAGLESEVAYLEGRVDGLEGRQR